MKSIHTYTERERERERIPWLIHSFQWTLVLNGFPPDRFEESDDSCQPVWVRVPEKIDRWRHDTDPSRSMEHEWIQGVYLVPVGSDRYDPCSFEFVLLCVCSETMM